MSNLKISQLPSLAAASATAADLVPVVNGGATKAITMPDLVSGANGVVNAKSSAYGAKGDGTTDDTTALQAAINATPAGGTLFLPNGTYKITAALVISTGISFEGQSVIETFTASIDVPTSPYFAGTVIKQYTAATDILQLNGQTQTTNLRRLGLVFDSSIAGNTGHGVNATPTVSTGSGLTGFSWDDVGVQGHDGNHYAFYIVNPCHGTTSKLRGYGGGGVYTECNSTATNYGNLVHIHPTFQVVTLGTSAGYAHKSRTSSGSTGILNLITYIRPQCNVEGTGSTQATWTDVLGAGIPQNIIAIAPDLENAPAASNVLSRGSGTWFIGGTQQNNGDTHNTYYGYSSLGAGGKGGSNAAFGDSALAANTTGHDNVAVGYQALKTNATHVDNVAIGSGALSANDNSSNTAVGFNAMNATTGAKNTAVGATAGPATAGVNNATALGFATNPNAAGAVAIGVDSAGTGASTTVQNTIALGTVNHSIFIGGGAGLGSGVGSLFSIANVTTEPTANPTGGGLLYVIGGALKYRGSSGTVTTLGAA